MIIFIALITSGISSIIAGFFGSGAGMVAVPVLSELLKLQRIPNALNTHIAIGTTLAFSSILMAVSAYEQHKLGAINWSLYRRLMWPTILGVFAGSLLASILNGNVLRLLFGIVLLGIAGLSLFKGEAKTTWDHQKFHFQTLGFIAAMSVGLIGVGVINIPYLKKYGLPLINSIAMSVALGILTASIGTLIYILINWQQTSSISSCIGYVDWQLLIPFLIGSIVCAKVGVRLAHKISPNIMNYLFTGFVFLVAVKMLW